MQGRRPSCQCKHGCSSDISAGCAQCRYEYLRPKRSSLRARVPEADAGCLDFLAALLTIDPEQRLSAEEALQHPWLLHRYPPIPAD